MTRLHSKAFPSIRTETKSASAAESASRSVPQGAISRENPRETDGALCISCGACIAVCPEKARDYHGEAYLAARAGFEEKCAQYRKPEMYYIAEWE